MGYGTSIKIYVKKAVYVNNMTSTIQIIHYRPNYKSWKGRKVAASCAQWAEVTSRGPLRGLWQPPPQSTSSQHIRGPVNFPVGEGVVISQFPNLELEMKTPKNAPFWIFQLVTAPLLIEFRAESPHIKQATQKRGPRVEPAWPLLTRHQQWILKNCWKSFKILQNKSENPCSQ